MSDIRTAVQNRSRLIIQVAKSVPLADLRAWAEDIAEIVEERIASDYSNERAGGKAIKGVTDEHEQRKAREGASLKRGTMYGDLQHELDVGGFARITVRAGRIDIVWNDNDLIARVPHAEYQAESKVHGGKILALLKRDAATAAKYIRERLRDLARVA